MSIDKTYSPQGIEEKWYQQWLDDKLFESKPDSRPPYTIVIPPPNVTGVLHMGHALNNTIQDILIRRARLKGFNTCWVPGTDHASIATEAKVVTMLKDMGIDKKSLSRDEFLKYAWEWKEKYGGIILQQLKKLGCALDWSRVNFTMDPDYYDTVINVFIDLYNKGNIYRGVKMINWDPQAKTALSDEEVIYKEVQSNLYYVRYRIDNSGDSTPSPSERAGVRSSSGGTPSPPVGGKVGIGLSGDSTPSPSERAGARSSSDSTPAHTGLEYITIATTRPETILGDTAICVHPEDDRYKHLKGKFAFVPLINRRVPIIYDDYIDREFGTGALKVTPAHDINDYNLGLKHHLEVVDTLNDDGTMSKAAQLYIGEDRFVVRKKIVKELEEKGFLVKTEQIKNNNGFSERTNVVIEPRLSVQWWCNMTKMAKPALDAVMENEVRFYPSKFKNTYRHWMENIKDWCISRQLWWGQRIPAWYDTKGNIYVAKNVDEALLQAQLKTQDLRQDEDVLDTWFSSWLWPIEVFKGLTNPGNKDIQYYYPTSTLVTAPEIIFFWVARMIMAGFEYQGKKPFDNVYFTGIVRDKQGRKMSKSLGNSPDLLELIDKYGADAVRFGILISSPAGNDLLYDDKLCEQGRNFNNKLWNAFRLVEGWKVTADGFENDFAVEWFGEKLKEVQIKLEEQFKIFAISESLKTVYSLVWDDFCSWYLEMIKPDFEKPIGRKTYKATVTYFTELMKLLHPFIPFITEELYQHLQQTENKKSICLALSGPLQNPDARILSLGETLINVITNIRDLRVKNNIKPKDKIEVCYTVADEPGLKKITETLTRLAFINNLTKATDIPEQTISFTIKGDKYYIIAEREVDAVAEKLRLENELGYAKGFLESVMKKLNNERFVANAKPDVLDKEKQKAEDANNKIRSIQEELLRLGQRNN